MRLFRKIRRAWLRWLCRRHGHIPPAVYHREYPILLGLMLYNSCERCGDTIARGGPTSFTIATPYGISTPTEDPTDE